jgi:hypothetical protein
MEVSIPVGAQPVVPQPERTPVAVRAAVARLDVTVLPRFEARAASAEIGEILRVAADAAA